MDYSKYLLNKGKEDLLSSLKKIDKKIIDKKFKEYNVKTIEELKTRILEEFENILSNAIDDENTMMYFMQLLENENGILMIPEDSDIESLYVFVYNNGMFDTYYIPKEIKKIINKLLDSMTDNTILNLSLASNTPIIKDLRSLLEVLKVDDLKNIGRIFSIDNINKYKKNSLVDKIYNTLTNEECLKYLVNLLINREYKLLIKLINNNGIIQDNEIEFDDYNILYLAGIVFLFRRGNKFYISITDDVYNVLKNINLDDYKIKVSNNTKTYKLVRAMVELYGVVSFNDIKGSIDTLLKINREDNIVIYNNYFINRILDNDELYGILEDIIYRQKEIKRKYISNKELLKYSDYNYYEKTDEIDRFIKYLDKYNLDEDDINYIIKMISNMYKLGNKFVPAALGILQDKDIEVDESIFDYLVPIYNNTRIWSNNGWTPVELREDFYK